jgi:phosphinothricin acetyltransferase
MTFNFRPIADSDGKAVVDIFNHYVENSFAAFPEKKIPYEGFAHFKQSVGDHPFYAVEKEGKVIGFGMLRPHSKVETFDRAAEVSYFILPEYTGWGIGSDLLARLVEDAKARGIDTLLASISSENEESIRFHRRHGFEEAGRIRRIGRKFGKDFDVVWMQRFV